MAQKDKFTLGKWNGLPLYECTQCSQNYVGDEGKERVIQHYDLTHGPEAVGVTGTGNEQQAGGKQ